MPHKEIAINTAMQAVAIRVRLAQEMTICSLYSSLNHEMSVTALNDMANQLPFPYLILGDFNAHNRLWGCRGNNARGRRVEEILRANGLNILNNGSPTYITPNTESAIDLSICSPVNKYK